MADNWEIKKKNEGIEREKGRPKRSSFAFLHFPSILCDKGKWPRSKKGRRNGRKKMLVSWRQLTIIVFRPLNTDRQMQSRAKNWRRRRTREKMH